MATQEQPLFLGGYYVLQLDLEEVKRTWFSRFFSEVLRLCGENIHLQEKKIKGFGFLEEDMTE